MRHRIDKATSGEQLGDKYLHRSSEHAWHDQHCVSL